MHIVSMRVCLRVFKGGGNKRGHGLNGSVVCSNGGWTSIKPPKKAKGVLSHTQFCLSRLLLVPFFFVVRVY